MGGVKMLEKRFAYYKSCTQNNAYKVILSIQAVKSKSLYVWQNLAPRHPIEGLLGACSLLSDVRTCLQTISAIFNLNLR